MKVIKNILNSIKNGLKYIGRAIKLVFITIFRAILFILNNSIGLIFVKKVTPFTNPKKYDDDSPIWKVIRTILLVSILLVLIFSFKIIYTYTLGELITFILVNVGKLIGKNSIYGKILIEYGKSFSNGIGTTLYLSLIGTTTGFILSLLFGFVATLKAIPTDTKLISFFKSFGKKIINLYVTIIRGTPMMVQAMILFWGVYGFLKWDYLTAGLVVVSINTTAYLTEVMKGAILNVDKGQTEGALSLGLSNFQTMIYVVLPQAIKNSMASIGNEFVINIKDTSVLSVIMVVDLFRVAQLAQAKYLEPFPPYIIAACIYLFLTTTITFILRKVEKKLDIPTVNLPSAN